MWRICSFAPMFEAPLVIPLKMEEAFQQDKIVYRWDLSITEKKVVTKVRSARGRRQHIEKQLLEEWEVYFESLLNGISDLRILLSQNMKIRIDEISLEALHSGKSLRFDEPL